MAMPMSRCNVSLPVMMRLNSSPSLIIRPCSAARVLRIRVCCVHMGSRNILYIVVFRASSHVQVISSERHLLYGYFLADLLRFARRLRQEKSFTDRLAAEISPDIISTDGHFGFHAPHVPSCLICHQIRVILARLLRPFQLIADRIQFNLLRRFDRVLVPDFAPAEACLIPASFGGAPWGERKGH